MSTAALAGPVFCSADRLAENHSPCGFPSSWRSSPLRGGVSQLGSTEAQLQLALAGERGAGATASCPDFRTQLAQPPPRWQPAQRRTLTCCPQICSWNNHLLGLHSQWVDWSPRTLRGPSQVPQDRSSHSVQAPPCPLPSLLPNLRVPALPLTDS